MFFIVKYNWSDETSLTNKCSVGFFRSLKDAKKFVSLKLPFDKNRNTVVILKQKEGMIENSFPVEVYDWSEYYEYYIPVRLDDIRRRVTITY